MSARARFSYQLIRERARLALCCGSNSIDEASLRLKSSIDPAPRPIAPQALKMHPNAGGGRVLRSLSRPARTRAPCPVASPRLRSARVLATLTHPRPEDFRKVSGRITALSLDVCGSGGLPGRIGARGWNGLLERSNIFVLACVQHYIIETAAFFARTARWNGQKHPASHARACMPARVRLCAFFLSFVRHKEIDEGFEPLSLELLLERCWNARTVLFQPPELRGISG